MSDRVRVYPFGCVEGFVDMKMGVIVVNWINSKASLFKYIAGGVLYCMEAQ